MDGDNVFCIGGVDIIVFWIFINVVFNWGRLGNGVVCEVVVLELEFGLLVVFDIVFLFCFKI